MLQDEFKAAHPHDITPVEINDVVFAIHAAVLTMVTIVQVFIYEVRFVTYYSTVHLPFFIHDFFCFTIPVSKSHASMVWKILTDKNISWARERWLTGQLDQLEWWMPKFTNICVHSIYSHLSCEWNRYRHAYSWLVNVLVNQYIGNW